MSPDRTSAEQNGPVTGQHVRVLVVDDDPEMRALLLDELAVVITLFIRYGVEWGIGGAP